MTDNRSALPSREQQADVTVDLSDASIRPRDHVTGEELTPADLDRTLAALRSIQTV